MHGALPPIAAAFQPESQLDRLIIVATLDVVAPLPANFDPNTPIWPAEAFVPNNC
jgi:hypothetical protein